MSAAIVISGTLRADAQHRRTRDGSSLLLFELQPPTATGERPAVVRVTKTYGTGEAAAGVASARARRLRRGVRVVVSAAGMHAGRGNLVLQSVDQIDEPDLVMRNVTGEREG